MDYRSQTRTLSGLAAYANWSASLAGDGITERLQGARMSANAFEVLGVTPAAGRLLNESDDRPDAPPVVVLSHRLWQRQYGGSADVVGKTVRINGESFVIVGVLPAAVPAAASGRGRRDAAGARPRSASPRAELGELPTVLRPPESRRRCQQRTGGADRDLPFAPPAVSRRVRAQGGRARRAAARSARRRLIASRCSCCSAR